MALSNAVDALDAVTGEYRRLKKQLTGIQTPYEADKAAFLLMESVWININAISSLAMIPQAGTHAMPAFILLRSAFESSLTAYWLCESEDWQEREARWLGWMADYEQYLEGISRDSMEAGPAYSAQMNARLGLHRARREAMAILLPREAVKKRPKAAELVARYMSGREHYILYRMASQLLHGGHETLNWVSRHEDNAVCLGPSHSHSDWRTIIGGASWCVAKPGALILRRVGLPGAQGTALLELHSTLLKVVGKS